MLICFYNKFIKKSNFKEILNSNRKGGENGKNKITTPFKGR